VGFAVPVNVAKEILPQLREKGKVVRGWLGVQIQPITDDMAKSFRMKEAKGAVISDVTANSPAEHAGLKQDDVVVAADSHVVEDNGDLSSYIASKPPGTTVALRILRNGTEQTISVKLGTFPEETAEEDTSAGHGAELGMTLRNLTPDLASRLELPRTAKGVFVWDVEGGGVAEDAGLAKGDLIVSVNGVGVADVASFQAEIAKARPDGVARLRIRRGDQYTLLVLRLK
jgi:serine protease Do